VNMLVIIILIASALLSAILSAVLAGKKGFSRGYFWLGLFLNVIGFIYVAGLPVKQKSAEPVRPVPSAAVQAVNAKPSVQNAQPAKNAGSDSELVAVLTAAVAAFMDTSADGLVVRSYRRLKPGKPSWNRAGRFEQLNRY
jgi:hypothetical protein